MIEIKKRPTLVMTGGGTAGHVIPNFAIVSRVQHLFDIHYVGSRDSIEERLVAERGDLHWHAVTTGKLRRSFSPGAIINNLKMPFRVLCGIREARAHLKRIAPAVVFSKGGFVSYPVVRAAASLGIPVILHESDLTMGLANRRSLRYATTILTSFEKTSKDIKDAKWVGAPIRDEIVVATSNRPSDGKNLLVMGGSLGAAAINKVMEESGEELCAGWNVVHITGRGKQTKFTHPKYTQIEFANDMPERLAWADVVVTRAGAGAVFELLALQKPMVLVPLSTGRGDQIQNAREVESWGAAFHLPENALSGATLAVAINSAPKPGQLPNINGTAEIAKLLAKYAEN